MTEPVLPDRSLRAGERVLLIDRKKRRYLVTLEAGGEFHTHSGFIPHDDIIGQGEGAPLRSTRILLLTRVLLGSRSKLSSTARIQNAGGW